MYFTLIRSTALYPEGSFPARYKMTSCVKFDLQLRLFVKKFKIQIHLEVSSIWNPPLRIRAIREIDLTNMLQIQTPINKQIKLRFRLQEVARVGNGKGRNPTPMSCFDWKQRWVTEPVYHTSKVLRLANLLNFQTSAWVFPAVILKGDFR